MKSNFSLILVLVILLSYNVAATDIAYIVEKNSDAKPNVIKGIEELGYTYELINKDKISSTDFRDYIMIVLDDGRIQDAPINSYKSLIMNPNYYETWSTGIGSTTKNDAYNLNHPITRGLILDFDPYTSSGQPLYYLTRIKSSKAITVKSPATVDRSKFILAEKQNPRRVFFGITEANYWSRESKELFKNSIFWVINGEDKDSDGFYQEGDCNDNDPKINPGVFDTPYDGIDNNCDGKDLTDVDEDGFDAEEVGGLDCDDENPLFNPDSIETETNCRNDPPEFSGMTNKLVVSETQTAIINLNVTDPEGNEISYSINDTRFELNEEENRFVWETGYGDYGEYLVKIRASDGSLSNFYNILIEVRNTNRAPKCSMIPPLTWQEDTNVTLNLSEYCLDEDEEILQYYFHDTSNDSNITLESLAQESGIAKFRVKENWNGQDWIRFKISDGKNINLTNIIELEVTKVNDEPTFIGNTGKIDDISFEEDTNLTDYIDLDNFFSDIDFDKLFYNVTGNIHIDIVIDQSTGEVSFFPENNWFGEEIIVFSATDGISELVYSNAISLIVIDLNEPPLFINTTCQHEILEDEIYTCVLNAIDVEGDNIKFSVVSENNLICDINDNTLTYSSRKDYSGSASCIVRASDEFGGDNMEINVMIGGVNDAPEITSFSPSNLAPKIKEGVSQIFGIEYDDIDGDSLTVSWLLDSKEVSKNDEYTFNQENGSYILEAIISDSNLNNSQKWNIFVGDISDFTCKEVSGFICSEDEICTQSYLGVSDSNVCCPVTCTQRPPEFKNANTCSDEKLPIDSRIEIDFRDPSSRDDFEPGENVPIELRISNEFDEDYDFDIDISLYDLTEDDSIEDEKDSIDINSKDTEDLDFELDIPEDIKENNHAIFVRVIEDKGLFCNEGYIEINIEREKEDVRIEDLSITPNDNLICGDSASISLTVKNHGTSDWENNQVIIENKELGIYAKGDMFDLDEFDDKKDERNEDFNIKIPEEAEKGTYKIDAKVLYDEENEEIRKTIDLVLEECEEEEIFVVDSNIELEKLDNNRVVSQKNERNFMKDFNDSFRDIISLFEDMESTKLLVFILIFAIFIILFIIVLIRA